MSADAGTVDGYVAALPDDRRALVLRVLDVVRAAMPPGYREEMAFGMITWSVPIERYPTTYNKQPLQYVALASQKNYCSLYLMGLYSGRDAERTFRERWTDGGRKLDMGKSCLRFKRFEDLDVAALRDAIASTPVDAYLTQYEASRAARRS